MLLFRAKPSKSTFDIALNSSRRSTEHLKILPSIDSRVSKLKTQTTWKIQQQTTQHLETWPLTNTDAGQYTTQQLLWLRQATYWRTVLLDSTLKINNILKISNVQIRSTNAKRNSIQQNNWNFNKMPAHVQDISVVQRNQKISNSQIDVKCSIIQEMPNKTIRKWIDALISKKLVWARQYIYFKSKIQNVGENFRADRKEIKTAECEVTFYSKRRVNLIRRQNFHIKYKNNGQSEKNCEDQSWKLMKSLQPANSDVPSYDVWATNCWQMFHLDKREHKNVQNSRIHAERARKRTEVSRSSDVQHWRPNVSSSVNHAIWWQKKQTWNNVRKSRATASS